MLAHHNSVLVLGNTRGQQAGAWGPPAGLVTQESMETSGMVRRCDAFGVIRTTFRELGWKTPIFLCESGAEKSKRTA